MTFNKKKKGHLYVVTWDSDASLDDDDDSSDDEKKITKKKGLASIAINNKPSLFDTPSCFMPKATKVQSKDDESDDSESDEDEEYSKEDLMEMLEASHSLMDKKRGEYKELRK